MTEVEFLNLNAQILEAAGAVTATSLTLIFGYLAGLYFFLGRAPRTIRILGFAFMTIALAWSWAGQVGIVQIVESAFGRADIAISEGATYVYLTNDRLSFWINWMSNAHVVMNVVFIFIWLSFLYATFFYNWRRHDLPQSRG